MLYEVITLKREAWFFSADKVSVVREAQAAGRIHEALHGIVHALAGAHGEGERFIIEPEMRELGIELAAVLRAGTTGRKAGIKALEAALRRCDARLV